jgi:hypothetical protein
MFNKPDLTIKQVDHPSRICSCGHIPPEKFKIQEDGPEEPTRFFLICGQGINAIYCEICLCIAGYVSRQNKKGK